MSFPPKPCFCRPRITLCFESNSDKFFENGGTGIPASFKICKLRSLSDAFDIAEGEFSSKEIDRTIDDRSV